ncbi:hypothetical protein Mgra_00004607 [Meloidogyne graminicola]|uniref:Transmembrane protein n=1 Tax=Meloidogyne graminicola TaxID=189291 RepID=A0A8S9ZR52_9BILA|nr:hypothetical protein Mgra_00004607 [Meloidogyne graminicola]
MNYPVNSVTNSSSQQYFDIKPIKGLRAPNPIKPQSTNINSFSNSFTNFISHNSPNSLSNPTGNNKRKKEENNIFPSISLHQQLRADSLTFSSFSGQQNILQQNKIPKQQIPLKKYFVQEIIQQQQQQQFTLKNFLNSLKQTLFMACCFCCCPIFRCVLWFCFFELICTIYWWYCSLNNLLRIYTNIELKDIIFILFISGWLITLLVSTISICLAKYKNDSQWILPRLIQQTGLLIIGFLFVFILVIYFIGAYKIINNILINIYEYIYSENILFEEKQGIHEDLRLYFLISIPLTFFLYLLYFYIIMCN